MHVPPIASTGEVRGPLRRVGQMMLATVRLAFIMLGALTVSAVLLSHLYNETPYDPALLAIAVCGLLAIACGVILTLMSRNRRLKSELRRNAVRCEELLDRTWKLEEARRVLAQARDTAQSASRAKSRFLTTVSHEIRTPLSGIIGMADLLLATSLTPEQANYVRAARSSGEQLMALIEDILDTSKVEAGRIELKPKPFALVTLAEDVVELLAPHAQAKRLQIASDVDERLAGSVIGDAPRLRQVLLNLAGNAIKFTEIGGVGVMVESGPEPGTVTFEVRDTGIGIAASEQARIFDEFERAEGAPAGTPGGTGLGLAISRGIVERMGGRIAVESAPEAGATFRFTLALQPADDGAHGFAPPDLCATAVLLVAEASIEAALLVRRLRRWGAAVTHAERGHAALLLSERRWDAVLVDHALGAEAAAILAGAACATIARRIVLITPAERQSLDTLRDAGFTGYLVKPIRAVSLKTQLTATDERMQPMVSAAEPSAMVEPAKTSRRSLPILVAEDDEINALLSQALLGRLGHRPTMVHSGEAAVECWQTAQANGKPFALVLMDIHMPAMDGLEAARRIRAAEAGEEQTRTPIVALSANASADDRAACQAAGMDDVLVKPLEYARLAALIDRLTGSALAA